MYEVPVMTGVCGTLCVRVQQVRQGRQRRRVRSITDRTIYYNSLKQNQSKAIKFRLGT